MAGFVVKTLGLVVLLWLCAFYGYGNFILADSVVPVEGMEVEEWVYEYLVTGGISGILGFLCSAIWYYIGDNYAGESGIGIKYWFFFITSFVAGVVIAFLKMPPSIDGSGLSFIMVVLISTLTYYLSSLIASAEAVKYIPPLGEMLH